MPTILVAAGDAEVRTIVSAVIAADGHRAEVVDDSAGARERSAGDPVDLVVLDTALPGADLRSLATELRAGSARAGLPIVVVTVGDDADDEAWGADHQLAAPFDLDLLRSVVARLLAGDG